MTVPTFLRALERGRRRSDRLLAATRKAYERIIRSAASEAARTLQREAALTASDWQPPPEGTLVSALGVSVTLRQLQHQAVEATARAALERAGVAWDPEDPALQALLENTESWSGQAIGEAFQPQLRKLVADAFRDGLPVKETATLIRASFAETAPWQAEMLARSNLNMLGNAGMHYAVDRFNGRARAAGEKTVETKTWLTAGDAAVRATHAAAEHQTVPVGSAFQVGGSSLQFPGDPGGALKEILNCRCTTLYGTADRSGLTAAVPSDPMTSRQRRRALKKSRVRAATAAVTITVDDEQQTPTEVRWVSDIAFEGEATEDGRFILPDALGWREPPLTLMALTETGPGGHEGAFVAGRMDTFEKTETDIDGDQLPDGVMSVRSSGVFDMGGDNGAEVARLVGDETVRGISVDLAVLEWVFRDPETGEIIEPDEATEKEMERAFFGELQMAVREAQIMAATVCPTPAFANARIALSASGDPVLTLTTTFELVTDGVVASAAPVRPPRDWFFTAEPDKATPLTVTDDGHVYGHIAAWGSCHTGRQGECFQPPSSPSGYAYFNLGEIECGDGTPVACGQITMGTDHAPLNPATDWKRAKAHYENTGTCVADIRAIDGVHGIFVAGALRPNVTDEQQRALRAAKPSGDWRQITPGGPLEMIGALEVNIPGYPVVRPQIALAASAAHPEGEVVALIAGGLDMGFDRQMRVLAARAEGLEGLAALAEA